MKLAVMEYAGVIVVGVKDNCGAKSGHEDRRTIYGVCTEDSVLHTPTE